MMTHYCESTGCKHDDPTNEWCCGGDGTCGSEEREPRCDAGQHVWTAEDLLLAYGRRAGRGGGAGQHVWTAEELLSGCRENPGVWSLGGTTIGAETRCRRCDLRRHETWYGSQRNPGQCDSVYYTEAPSAAYAAYAAYGDE